ncbi:Oligopeptide transport ATP-binding protein OppF [subsurface metagenome]
MIGDSFKKSLRKNIQMVFQDPDASLNPRWKIVNIIGEPLRLLMGMRKKHKIRQRVIELLETVSMKVEHLDRFPHEFSGGQKQRIAIARMLLADPTVLVFDDASSAVDSETEDKINTAINRVLKDRTSFIITHRLSTIRHSDIIIVLKQGTIKAIGIHDQLLKESVDYWRVFARFSEIRKMMPEQMISEMESGE